ncbi:MAG: DUF2194 domain-containing protein [Oscillospiraceae bacterium]|nr:DUF2194 domain-containing protein [Oscillospiraceae bacterium]
MLFQFSIVGRDLANNYDENIHMTDTELSSADVVNAQSLGKAAQTVLYIGSEDDASCDIVRQWCDYTRRNFVQYNSLDEYTPLGGGGKALLLCLSGKSVTTSGQVDALSAMVQDGQDVLLCDMPDTAMLRQLPILRALLGIRSIESESVELIGIHLFSGFLLGDEVIYSMEEESENHNKEIHLFAPWYTRLSGTKSYMAGMLADEDVENEDRPSLIWRNSYGKGRVFVINGPYMQDETGLGILSAALHEMQEYTLYPVVNAQNLSVANFPILALENTNELMDIYARDMHHLQSNLMWPDMILSAGRGRYKLTSFLSPRYNYNEQADLQTGTLIFYLKQFREQSAEAGLSLDYMPGTTLQDKLNEDQVFFDSSDSKFPYSAAYIGSTDKEAFEATQPQGILENIRTITGTWDNTDILSYCTDTITAQKATADGFEHTYQQDLRVRAIETALGYSNILLDMKRIAWPEEDDFHWEVLSEIYSSNINTHWRPFYDFEKTTLTESDERVRSFFALDYAEKRKKNTISVEIKNDGESWFLLRTHAEKIKSITGGDYTKVENDVYLIHATEKSVQIELEQWQKKRYYVQ